MAVIAIVPKVDDLLALLAAIPRVPAAHSACPSCEPQLRSDTGAQGSYDSGEKGRSLLQFGQELFVLCDRESGESEVIDEWSPNAGWSDFRDVECLLCYLGESSFELRVLSEHVNLLGVC